MRKLPTIQHFLVARIDPAGPALQLSRSGVASLRQSAVFANRNNQFQTPPVVSLYHL